MTYGSNYDNHQAGNAEAPNSSERKESLAKGDEGRGLPSGGQSVALRPVTNASCGCTGGGSWVFMVIVASVLVLYVFVSILK